MLPKFITIASPTPTVTQPACLVMRKDDLEINGTIDSATNVAHTGNAIPPKRYKCDVAIPSSTSLQK